MNSRSCVSQDRRLRKPCCLGVRMCESRWVMVALVRMCSRTLHGMLVREIGRYLMGLS